MFRLIEFDMHPNHGDKYYDVKVCKDCGRDAEVEHGDRQLCKECLKDYEWLIAVEIPLRRIKMEENKYSYKCPHCNYVCNHDYEPFKNIKFKKCEECDSEGTPKQKHTENILRISEEIKKLNIDNDRYEILSLIKEIQDSSVDDYMYHGEWND